MQSPHDSGSPTPRTGNWPPGKRVLRAATATLAAVTMVILLPQPAAAEGQDSPDAQEQAAIDAKIENAPVQPGTLTFGTEPLHAVENAAEDAAAAASCEITGAEATALSLAPVWPEVSDGEPDAPSPMTLSRYDNQDGLYDPQGRDGLFFNPGVGLWQLDSAGFGANNSAGQAIDAEWAAELVTPYIVDRYCDGIDGGQAPAEARATAWTDWNACAEGACEDTYQRALNDGVQTDDSVGQFGGAEPRTCEFEGETHDCLFVDTDNAQGADWWAQPDSGASPVPHAFYVFTFEAEGATHEARTWLTQDSGAGTEVTVVRQFGIDAREGLAWHDDRGLCDVTEDRGDC